MPILSYFLVVGSVLTGLLLWFGNGSETPVAALTSSSTPGISTFKPEPEDERARATAVNFAAVRGRPERKPARTADTPPRQKAATNYPEPKATNYSESKPLDHFAEFPHNNLSIH
jgi:hypothetical protein